MNDTLSSFDDEKCTTTASLLQRIDALEQQIRDERNAHEQQMKTATDNTNDKLNILQQKIETMQKHTTSETSTPVTSPLSPTFDWSNILQMQQNMFAEQLKQQQEQILSQQQLISEITSGFSAITQSTRETAKVIEAINDHNATAKSEKDQH